ncbi:type II toxin-antitoxin system RelE/ParE family toxin [Cronobacter malonaticus]|uniref:type II toxin-antitoxin system RelE/ParE family toxin n=1 Tax=Cronobacter malonaticus TaxID=413503 RepID=UPI0009B908E5|nr:type II toxin-antitoxin system RelE/ParE family toxin [Cronobacter malonaticus]EGT4370761.1 type II toxin-antitoxin system RelE/ParE family toxin [Cronobacter malonaticus]ELY4818673.1 type II toxin-antitoxin system RelE/ParE family toxin [Cronobacter malonaticus]ELY6230231.1 type II toxin-antitoxin system RelE/ParE family toxin [Cronobacter malonaticus]MDI6469857.1 type II toxin-antitoxin system RelE/ParE family toxin [Cronobacter malonaticus]MDI7689861.1 type II toxin-antitoxin system RelE
MTWMVIFTDRFNDWYQQQPEGLQDRIAALLWNLRYSGPLVGRPLVDTVKGSRYPNLKELRVQYGGEPWRVFFAFDAERQAVVLCAGNKRSQKHFYDALIRQAEEEFFLHVQAMERRNENY